MKSHEIRSTFLDFFKKNQHSVIPSSSLVLDNDPTLLFANAGMNQFKNVFLGLEEKDYRRAVSSQKCVRAGGKHNDLENVGHTARHHTFFEMLGNFSFGDYFKKEAIHLAWTLVTKELGLSKDRLYVSVFEKDDEAANIWHQQEGIPRERIFRFGEKDNFWRMGNSGPCGPSSEIFYDLGPEVGGDPKTNVMGGEGDRFVEFWNLVFMQYNENEVGEQTPLPNPSIDTGAGLERLSTILQGETNNYHTDAFQDLIAVAMKTSGHEYIKNLKAIKASEFPQREAMNVAFRVVADHSRAAAFLLADGVRPSNEGRGYVLRRILRRGIRYSQKLSDEKSLMVPVINQVIKQMKNIYPELERQKSLILSSMEEEEKRFISTLSHGTQILMDAIQKLTSHQQNTLPGEIVFKLYDTFGFPMDLTRLIAAERGIKIDEAEFDRQMEKARQTAKASWKGHSLSVDQARAIQLTQALFREVGPTHFNGYHGHLNSQGKILLLFNGHEEKSSLSSGDEGWMAFESTCFYAESGGQAGDTGLLTSSSGNEAEVSTTTKLNDIYLHHVKVTRGEFKKGDRVQQQVKSTERMDTAANHSATHLLHAALRQILGPHVQQAGSSVEPTRLRFDFTHPRSLNANEIEEIEDRVNEEIARSHSVSTKIMTPAEAQTAGALALFGEKYGDQVRVVQMGDYSMELCGGTHVENTASIRVFKIMSEGSVSAGVRRIEAMTGSSAIQFLMKNARENRMARNEAGLNENLSLTNWIEHQKEETRRLQKELTSQKAAKIDINELMNQSYPFEKDNKKGQLLWADLPVDDRKILNDISDKIRDRLSSGILVLIGQATEGQPNSPLLVSVSKNWLNFFSANQILKDISKITGGKGGGRADFAQGAIVNRHQLTEAQNKIKNILCCLK